jgi:hypothetical protein
MYAANMASPPDRPAPRPGIAPAPPLLHLQSTCPACDAPGSLRERLCKVYCATCGKVVASCADL